MLARLPRRSAAVMAFACVLEAAAAAPETLRLWDGDAPGARGQTPQDVPTLTRYTPPAGSASGTAVVICPGGGYGGLAGHEGRGYAEFLAAHGVEAIVLRYRLGSSGYRHPVMLDDARRAIRMVRAHAAEWGIDPHRIGIMGSSAGGHLASTALVHSTPGDPQAANPVERASSRPDFGVLCYAVISMRDGVTHGGSRTNLLGKSPSPQEVALLSSDEHVTKDTPPCFVWSTGADTGVSPDNSLRFATALQRAGVPYDFHIYQKGGHGIGLGGKPGAPHPWAADLLFWLRENGWANH